MMRLLAWGSVGSSRSFAFALAVALACAVAPGSASALEPEESGQSFSDWWSENFQVHGYLSTKAYFRTPNFNNDVELSSWRTEIDLETELHLFENDDWRVGLFSVIRPTFDAIYDVQPDLWGNDLKPARFGTANPAPDNANASRSGKGKNFPGAGGWLEGEYTIINSDTGSYFTGELTPSVAIDDVVFFGRVTAPVLPRGSGSGIRQNHIGGNATGETYQDFRDNFPVPNGGLPLGFGLDASLENEASRPLDTPLNWYAGAKGSVSSFKHGSSDVNRTESQLKWDCRDNAHPWCAVRELYAEIEYKNTFVRVGKQQIVWGKTDAFRLQDKINPIDLGYHNVFPSLEDRRIPQLSLDAIQSFGDVGPFEDVSLEFAWVFDQFLPDQFGQCGEPYAFTVACQIRVDAGAHQLFNIALAGVDVVDWTFENTEPGLRLEFRLPEPSIAFSLSAFYTHQDTPVARVSNHYSTDNPNPAIMLFLQGLYSADAGAPVANVIEALSGNVPGTTVWTTGFDPYDYGPNGRPTPGGSLDTANQILQDAWTNAFVVFGCNTLTTDRAIGACIQDNGFQIFGFPWSTSEALLRYPRVWALGASMDYQVPGIDTVLRVEMAADLDRHIPNTAKYNFDDKSPVFQAAIGLDRSTFIPFLNRNRTALLSVQTFFEHIVDYDDGRGPNDGMVPYETSIVSTALMQNYWRNDSIVLTNFVAVDWKAEAVILGPSLRWYYSGNLFFEGGLNLLFGQKREHNLGDLCSDRTLSCAGDPSSWKPGQWQMINANVARSSEHPWWAQESFADKLMRARDEFWLGVTYQF